MTSNSSTIKGLSIACLVLSILGVLVGIGLVALFGMYSAYMSDPNVSAAVVDQVMKQGTSSAFDGSYAYSTADVNTAMALSGGVFVGMGVGYLACRVVALVAAILALRNYNDAAKLRGAFIWGIIAIVLCVFTGSFISAVLFLILVIFISRARREFAAQQPAAMYGAPQPVQPVQPATEQKPESQASAAQQPQTPASEAENKDEQPKA
jgi:hypothetical protein